MACERPALYADVYVDDDEIYYIGEITQDRNNRLFEVYQRERTKPSTLVITSPGGNVKHGLDLGDWVFDHSLSLRVPNECGSSCANYVFTAARSVELAPDALLYWHGSPTYDDLIAGTVREPSRWASVRRSLEKNGFEGSDAKAYWQTIRRRNHAFFERVGVSPLITVALQLADGRTHAGQANFSNHRQWAYYLTIDDMAIFGRDNVTVKNESGWNPRSNPGYKDNVVRLDLATDVSQRISLLEQSLEQGRFN